MTPHLVRKEMKMARELMGLEAIEVRVEREPLEVEERA